MASPTANLAIVLQLPFARKKLENVFVHQELLARNAINAFQILSDLTRLLDARNVDATVEELIEEICSAT